MKESAYSFSEIISLLISLERFTEAQDLLLDYSFLEKKVYLIGVNELIEDYKNLLGFKISDEQKKKALKMLLSALEQTSHILNDHPKQVNSQLIGFLQKGKNRYIDSIIATIDENAKDVRLRPVMPSLASHQGNLKKVFAEHTENITALAVCNDDKWILSGTAKGKIKAWNIHSGMNIHSFENEEKYEGIIFLKGVADKYILSLSKTEDKTILRSWSLVNKCCTASISGKHREGLTQFEISPCESYLIIKNVKTKMGISILSIPDLKQIQHLTSKLEIDNFEVYEFKKKSFLRNKQKFELRIIVSSFYSSYKSRISVFSLVRSRFKRIKRFFTKSVSASPIHQELIIREKTNTLLMIGLEPIVRLYCLKSGKCLREFLVASKDIRIDKVLLVRNESEILVFTSDSKVYLWHLGKNESGKYVGDHVSGNPVKNIIKNEFAFSYAENSILKIWDLKEVSTVNAIATRTIVNHIHFISGLGFISNEKENINLWKKGVVLDKKDINHESPIKALEIFDEYSKVFTISSNGMIKLYDVNDLNHLDTITNKMNEVNVASIFHKGQRHFALISNKIDGKHFFSVYDLVDRKYESDLNGYHLSDIAKVETFRNGKAAISISFDYTAKVWDLINEECVYTLYITDHDKANQYGFGITFEIYNHEINLITATFNGTLRVWDLQSGRLIKDLIGHKGSINSIDISRNGKRAITSSADGTIRLWDLENWECSTLIKNEEGVGFDLAQFMPYNYYLGKQHSVSNLKDFQETHIMAVTGEKVIKVWDVSTKQYVQEFVGHSDKISTLFVLRKSKRLVSATYSGEIVLWDILNGKEITELHLGRGITTVEVIEDKNLIIVGELNGQVHLISIVKGENKLKVTKSFAQRK